MHCRRQERMQSPHSGIPEEQHALRDDAARPNLIQRGPLEGKNPNPVKSKLNFEILTPKIKKVLEA